MGGRHGQLCFKAPSMFGSCAGSDPDRLGQGRCGGQTHSWWTRHSPIRHRNDQAICMENTLHAALGLFVERLYRMTGDTHTQVDGQIPGNQEGISGWLRRF